MQFLLLSLQQADVKLSSTTIFDVIFLWKQLACCTVSMHPATAAAAVAMNLRLQLIKNC